MMRPLLGNSPYGNGPELMLLLFSFRSETLCSGSITAIIACPEALLSVGRLTCSFFFLLFSLFNEPVVVLARRVSPVSNVELPDK